MITCYDYLIVKELSSYCSQTKVIISLVIVIFQLFTDNVSINRIKFINTYCSPLSITIDFHTSLIRISIFLKIYHTREWITVPNPCRIYNKCSHYIERIYMYAHSSTQYRIIIVNISTSTINVCIKRTLKDSEVIDITIVEVIHFHR